MKKLDSIDLDILAALYADSSVTNKELANKVNIAASTCLERVKRLSSAGVIRRFGLDVNYKAVGGNIEAMTSVRLGQHSRKIIDEFKRDLLTSSEVIQIFHMGGENDFLLHITVSDTEHLRDFVFKSITSRAEVIHLETALIYEQVSNPILPNFTESP